MRTVLRTLSFVLLTCSVFAACTDLAVIPADAQLVCTSDDDCPDGFACRIALGRCLDNARAQAAPIAVVTATTVVHQRRSQQPGFSIVEASASFSTAPVAVGGLLDDGVALACTVDPAPDHVVRCTLDLADVSDLVDGEHDVTVFADDGLGTIASSRARVTVDLVAPDVVEDAVVVTYVPDETNALETTSAVGPTSNATVQLSLTEVPGAAPVAAVAGAPTALAFAPAQPTGLVATLLVDGAALSAVDDGPVDVTVELTDDVGNARTTTLPALLQVDHTAPNAAAVADEDAVVYARIPEGSRATAGVAQFTLTIAGGVEANAVVVVTTAADFNSTTLGDAVADDTGSAVINLAPVDLPSVFVHVVDAAGNVSAAARVRDIVWTASLGGRVAGNQRSNPHALFSSTDFDGVSLARHLQNEVATASELVTGGVIEVVASGAFVEDPVLNANAPTTARASLVWHAARGELLAFGGIDVSGLRFTSRTLRLDGERWNDVTTGGTLPPAADGVAVYDPIGERVVLVQDDGQTWFLENNTWRALVGDTPTAASGATVAFDEARRGIVRFGGQLLNSTTRHDETWFLDGETWQQLEFSTSPGPRSGAAMAFDRIDNGLVLRGGRNENNNVLTDLWRLDSGGWQLLRDDDVVGYADGVAVTDPESGRVQFVGGTFGGQSLATALQTFNGAQLVSSTTIPAARSSGAAWDLAQRRLVILGGSGFNLGPNLLRNFVIIKNGEARSPGERAPLESADNARVTYDRGAGKVVLFGGSFAVGAGTAVLQSTRLWNGVTKQPVGVVNVDGPLPATGLFFDGSSVGSFGGGDVLRLSADGWIDVAPLPAGIPTFSTGFAFHAGDDVAFGFGGSTNSIEAMDTTITVRDGIVNIVSPATSPPPRRSAQLAYDARHARVVLYGGTTSQQLLRDTWVFEEETWRPLDTQTSDVGEARLLYDEARGVVVRLANGSGTRALLVDELRDDRWVRRDVHVPGTARSNFNATWDVARGNTFVQGGFTSAGSTNDLFTWDGDVRTTPAVLMAVDLRARETRATSVRAIDIVAAAGATGADLDGAALDGIDVLVWGDGWERVGDGGASATAAAQVSVRLDEATQLRRIVKNRLIVGVQAAAPSGGGPAAALRVEALEVTVRYREE